MLRFVLLSIACRFSPVHLSCPVPLKPRLCKDPEKRFCPSCGGPTLIRTSITYVTASPEHPQGYILHLKKNFQYKLRGTQYSLPTPKMGRAGGQGSVANPVLREDQKEWVKGVKSAEIKKDKEQRRIVRAVFDESRRAAGAGGSHESAGGGGLPGFNDLDWQVSSPTSFSSRLILPSSWR